MTTRKIRLVVAAFPGVQVLDVTGPMAVFTAANRLLPKRVGYDLSLSAETRGVFRTSGPIELRAHLAWADVDVGALDVLVVAGGMPGTDAAVSSPNLLTLIRTAAAKGARVAAVCTGSFVLAAAGVLDGRRCTTHWQYIERLRTAAPKSRISENVLFVEDRGIWTSAGVTAGMDMALAMVADDFGSAVSAQVAQDLVMFAVRPGSQKQISESLDLPPTRDRKFRDLILWVRANPTANLDLPTLAARCSMTTRTFTRRFREECGTTPAKMVELARFSAAKSYLRSTAIPLSRVASLSGFPSKSAMDAAFARRMGISAGAYRAQAGADAVDDRRRGLIDIPEEAPPD